LGCWTGKKKLDFFTKSKLNFDKFLQESTSNVLSWEMAFLLNHPECLAKLHAEMDQQIIGTDRLITVADRPNLNYTNAVISVNFI
jgi:hypothetical protein